MVLHVGSFMAKKQILEFYVQDREVAVPIVTEANVPVDEVTYTNQPSHTLPAFTYNNSLRIH